MSAVVTLAVDAMGGDHGLPVTVPAVARVLARHANLNVIMVGAPDALAPELKKEGLDSHPRVSVAPASEVVAMDDPVAVALRLLTLVLPCGHYRLGNRLVVRAKKNSITIGFLTPWILENLCKTW